MSGWVYLYLGIFFGGVCFTLEKLAFITLILIGGIGLNIVAIKGS